MTMSSNAILRPTNTPTVLEEYEADQTGYDSFIEGDKVIAVSKEYDEVSGNESLYKAVFQHVAVRDGNRDGNESFFESVKKGGTWLIQKVKDFFSWLFKAFTGKSERIEYRLDKITREFKAKGIKVEPTTYGHSVYEVYSKPGSPPAHLNWVVDAEKAVEGAAAKQRKYLDTIKKVVAELQALITRDNFQTDDLNKIHHDFDKDVRDIFGTPPGQTAEFIGPYGVDVNAEGRLHVRRLRYPPPMSAKLGTFTTTQSEFDRLLVERKRVHEVLVKLLEESVQLEKVLIKNLTVSMSAVKLDTQDHGRGKAMGMVKQQVLNALAAIKDMDTTMFRISGAITTTLGSAVKD